MRILALWLSAAAVATAGEAAAVPPITKSEARQMSLEKTKRRVLEQLGDILVEEARPERKRQPIRPLDDLAFTTQPRSTYMRGLCAYDEVRISFRPTTHRDLGADTPVRASGVEASTRYGLLTDAEAVANDEGEPRDADDRACRELPRDQYFGAENEQMALEAASWLQRMAKAATTATPVTCTGIRPLPDDACRAHVAGFKVTEVWHADVRYFRRDQRGAELSWTYMLSHEGVEYDVEVYGRHGTSDVLLVEVSESIVLAHERVD